MTTLILDRRTKTLYADKNETYGKNGITIKCIKIVPVYLKNGFHWGWAAQSGPSAEWVTYLRYLSFLDDIDQIKDTADDRPRWRKLGGFLVSREGNTYVVDEEGVPIPMEDHYMCDGAGYVEALLLLDAGVSPPQVFKLISERTSHTSKEYDSIEYGKKNAKIIYNQTYQG